MELGYTEWAHLQEWIANQPDIFEEELLIIQKKFDGFDETREPSIYWQLIRRVGWLNEPIASRPRITQESLVASDR